MLDKGGAVQAEIEDLGKYRLISLAIMALALLVYYYWPCLSGQSDFYISDLTYYFQPFCSFINHELKNGRIALWNPYLYCGMPQLAMPSPGLLYPLSWVIFLLPFSAGLSLYMIFHQLLMGAGTYLYLRDIKSSKTSAMFGALVLTLCAYHFSFVRNLTLPASMAWLPLALYFERNIKTGIAERPLRNMLGLALCVAMLVHIGRPEVGAPELILLFLACVTKPVMALFSRGNVLGELQATMFKLGSLGLGVALGLPSIAPGIEWTTLSPRAQGMAPRWVFIWSSNWYDYLSVVLSQPLGDLCFLNDHTANLRRLVLSRGGYLPFLTSSYLSSIVFTMSIWGLSDRKNKMLPAIIFLLIGFIFMSAGIYTPVAPAIVSLSPFLAAFRYPVKLMIFPELMLVLLAVRGLDLLLGRRLSPRVLWGTTALWVLVALLGVLFETIPQIGLAAGKWKWLFRFETAPAVIKAAQVMFGNSMLYAAGFSLATCLSAFLSVHKKVKPANAATVIILLTCGTLIHSAVTYRRIAPGGFYEQPSTVGGRIEALRKEQSLREERQAVAPTDVSRDTVKGVSNIRGWFCVTCIEPVFRSAHCAGEIQIP